MRAILALVLCTGLAGCGSTAKAPPVTNIVTCPKIIAPAQVPLRQFEFRKLDTLVPGGPVYGLTSSDASAVLENQNTMNAREAKWQERANAHNACVDRALNVDATKQDPKPKKRFRFW